MSEPTKQEPGDVTENRRVDPKALGENVSIESGQSGKAFQAEHSDHDHEGHDHSDHVHPTSAPGHSHNSKNVGKKSLGAKTDHSGHSHGHLDFREQSRSAMIKVLVLTACYMFVELGVGLYSHSLALLADAGHMLSDVGAIVLALVAYWFSGRPATPGKTYGYYRSEILAGFFNALLLVGISTYIIFESYQRLRHPPVIEALPVLLTALCGFGVNLFSVKILHKDAQKSINAKAAYLEVLSDAMATFGVVLSSIVILTTKWYVADPIVSGIIGIAIFPRTWSLLLECINILMEGTPGHIDLSQLRRSMLDVDGVLDVHDIHVWTITSGLDAMSGHVAIDNRAPSETVLTAVTKLLNDEYGLHHTTIQVEQVECKDKGHEACD